MYLVSACLAGFNTRYDSDNRLDERVKTLVEQGKAIPVCPEQLAGLSTPRPPVEFESGDGLALLEGQGRVLTADGEDRSSSLRKGAEEVLSVATRYNIKEAVLKDGSPSCGVTYVYSGGSRTPGVGVTAGLLQRNGIKVITVDSL